MEYNYSKGVIKLPNKELTILDKLVLKFIRTINFNYVIVSGYVAILFARPRNTEDIDIFIEKITLERFNAFCNKLDKLGFYMLNAENTEDAYDMLENGFSVRFAEKNTVTPNFEVKFPKADTDTYSLKNPLRVTLDEGNELKVSPLELQIAYKLYLGSEKDEDDARHLYGIFKNYIDKKELRKLINYLNVNTRKAESILGGKLG